MIINDHDFFMIRIDVERKWPRWSSFTTSRGLNEEADIHNIVKIIDGQHFEQHDQIMIDFWPKAWKHDNIKLFFSFYTTTCWFLKYDHDNVNNMLICDGHDDDDFLPKNYSQSFRDHTTTTSTSSMMISIAFSLRQYDRICFASLQIMIMINGLYYRDKFLNCRLHSKTKTVLLTHHLNDLWRPKNYHAGSMIALSCTAAEPMENYLHNSWEHQVVPVRCRIVPYDVTMQI